jgi:hypothetical protein
MRTTIDMPDELFRRTKATAALAGETIKEFVTTAVRERLERQAPGSARSVGWRAVFGLARVEDTEQVDRIIRADLEEVNPEDWQ